MSLYLEGFAETDELKNQANTILTQLRALLLSPDAGPGVVLVGGIQGRRGSGKTSLLRTLGTQAPSDVWKVLKDGEEPRLFEPAKNGQESLIADLMEHLNGESLEERSPAGCSQSTDVLEATDQVYIELARRQEPKKFIEIASEEAPSIRNLPEHLGREIQRRAQSNLRLAKAISQRLDEVAEAEDSPNRALLLLVDDFDLASKKIIVEFFELIHLYLTVSPGQASVVVMVAYDRETLAKALESKERSKSLAWAQIAKHIPYTWQVRTLSIHERFAILRPSDDQGALEPFWPDEEVCALLYRAIQNHQRDQDTRKRDQELEESGRAADIPPDDYPDDPQDEEPYSRSDLIKLQLAPPMLPTVPRLVKRLHNRLLGLSSQSGSDTLLAHYKELLREGGSYDPLDERAILPFVSMVVAADIVKPALDLWSRFVGTPRAFSDHLRQVLSSDSQACKVEEKLANTWGAWADIVDEADKVDEKRSLGLALSVNADATETIPDWFSSFPEERRLHLDFRALIEQRNSVTSAEVPKLLEALAERVKNSSLGDQYLPLRLVSRAPLPLMLWLGWYLNRHREVVVYNLFGQMVTPFIGPVASLLSRSVDLLPDPNSSMSIISETYEGEEYSKDALFLIELFGQKTDLSTVRLLNLDGKEIKPKVRVHIHRPSSAGVFQPEHLEETLQFIIDHIANIHWQHETRRSYLCLRMPDVVAFFLGHNLRPGMGEIVLGEFERRSTPPTYHPVGLLDDPPALTAP